MHRPSQLLISNPSSFSGHAYTAYIAGFRRILRNPNKARISNPGHLKVNVYSYPHKIGHRRARLLANV